MKKLLMIAVLFLSENCFGMNVTELIHSEVFTQHVYNHTMNICIKALDENKKDIARAVGATCLGPSWEECREAKDILISAIANSTNTEKTTWDTVGTRFRKEIEVAVLTIVRHESPDVKRFVVQYLQQSR